MRHAAGAVRETRIDVGGAELWVARSGAGVPIALAPGGPGCCDYLQPVAEMLDDRAEVIRFEARGCGRSDPAPSYDLATTVRDLERLRSALGHPRWIVGGHSFGANLALAYALEHPGRTLALLYLAGNGLQNDRQWHAAYHQARIVHGEVEPAYRFPPNLQVNAQELAAALPCAKVSRIPGACHFLWLEQAAELRGVLRAFLDSDCAQEDS